MNDVMNMNQQAEKTMSSREIAELTGKSHTHVMRDTRKMFNDLELDGSSFGSVYKAGNGESRPCFNLDREMTDCLLTGYSTKMRMAVIKRWRELEEQKSTDPMQALSDPATMRALLLNYTEKVLELESTVHEQAPKVAFYESVGDSTGLLSMNDAIKSMNIPKMGRNKAMEELRSLNILQSSLTNRNVPYQQYINQGYFNVKQKVIGNNQTVSVALVTPKGLQWLYKKLA
jgi:phage antirepressor YoqD-like protein